MSTKRGPGAGIHSGEELYVRDRHARIVLGTSVLGWPNAPSFRRVTEQLLDHGGDGFSARALQDPFLAARAGDPRLSPEAFLARVDPSTPLGRVVEALLGPASAKLLRTLDRAEFEAALRAHYRDFRTHEPPYDAGVSYGAYRYRDGSHVDLRDTSLLVLPPNAPRFDRDTRAWLYPDYDDHARPRANRSVAAVQASRVWNREIPLGLQGKELFDELGIEHSLETVDPYLDPELVRSRLQIAFTLSTGNSPIYRSAVEIRGAKYPGLRFAVERNADQARWELAARMGSHILDPATDLAKVWRSTPKRGRGERPKATVPHDAFSQLSVDELFRVALRLPDAPRVLLNTFEWEHHRSQRFTKRMLSLAERLKLGPERRSRFAMLTGICEPENLHLVPPWMHAREDFFAGSFAPDWKRVWVAGEFKTEAFLPNRTRIDRYGNALVPPDRGATPFVFPPEFPNAPWTPRRFPDAEVERAKDALVAYEPRHVIALLIELSDDEVQRAARKRFAGSSQAAQGGRATWNGLVDQLNTAADVYGVAPPTLRIPRLR